MKGNWVISDFEECLEKVIYSNKIQRQEFLKFGKYPIISQEKDLISGYWNNQNDLFKIKKPVIIFGDHTKVFKYIDFDFVLGADGVKILQPNDSIEPKYLFYYLQNIELENLGYARHYRILKELKVKYPESITEQKRIVAILDEAFAAIDKAKANAEKNLQNSKELFESYLHSVFANPGEDWEEKTLGEIGKPSMCKRIMKHQTSSAGDIPFYKIGTFGKTPDAYISREIYNEYRTKYSFPKNGDILISASGTIGRTVRYDGEPAFFQDSNIVWIDNDERQVLNDYLYVFYKYCNWQPSKGATISRLYNNNLVSIKIIFPSSYEEQKSIFNKINVVSSETKKLQAIYEQKIKEMGELKKSILQKAFNGELNTTKDIELL